MAKGKPHKNPKKFSLNLGDQFAAIFPEHLGDIFALLLVVVLSSGAVFFWVFAWIPAGEFIVDEPSAGIPVFSEGELTEIVEILEAREEASTAPVEPPPRDPFN